MGLFDKQKPAQMQTPQPTVPPAVAACDSELASIEQQRQSVYMDLGYRYAQAYTVEQAAGTEFEAGLKELSRMAQRSALLEKRKLAVQNLRKCEKCGNVLVLDSAFCNMCGQPLAPLEPEVMTDGPLCPQCKAPLEPGVQFCTHCGMKLTNDAPAQPQAAAPAPQPTVLTCPKCGAVYNPTDSFCVQCGQPLNQQG